MTKKRHQATAYISDALHQVFTLQFYFSVLLISFWSWNISSNSSGGPREGSSIARVQTCSSKEIVLSIFTPPLLFGQQNKKKALVDCYEDPLIQFSHFWESRAQVLRPIKARHRQNWCFPIKDDVLHINKGKKFITHHFLKKAKNSIL